MRAPLSIPRSCAAALIILSVASLALAYEYGPPPSRTGAPAIADKPAEGLCTECHVDASVNSAAGSLRWLDLPAYYVPGRTYTLRLRLTHAWNPIPIAARWGFQAQAMRMTTGDSAGVWIVTAPDTMQLVPPTAQLPELATRRYIEHVATGIHEGQPGPSVEWTLRWQAPLAPEGMVRFQAAGVAASGENLPYFDHLYTAVDSLAPLPGADVAETPSRTNGMTFESPWPQPSRANTALRFTLTHATDLELAIFDAQGRRVRTLAASRFAPGVQRFDWDGRDEDGRMLPTGAFLARLRTNDGASITRRVLRVR